MTGIRTYISARQTITQEVFLQMEAVANYKRALVDFWLDQRLNDLSLALHSWIFITSTGDSPSSESPYSFSSTDNSDFISTSIRLHEGKFLLSPDCDTEDSIWVAELFQRIATSGMPDTVKPYYFSETDYSEDVGTWFRVARLFPLPGGRYHIAAGRLKISGILAPLLLDSSGLGRSGESYLIGSNHTMLTSSRFMSHPPAGTHQMFSMAIDFGLQGKAGAGRYSGWNNQRVLGAWSPVALTGWVLVAEMDEAEALSGLTILRREWLWIAVATLAAIILASILFSRSLSRPILELADISRQVERGNLSLRSGLDSSDELGQLSRAFDRMILSLETTQNGLRQSMADLIAKEEQLIQSEKLAAIGELTASIVHEMRNPLAALEMNLKLVRRRTESGTILEEQLQIATSQTERISRMLTGLLEFSKPVVLKLTLCDLKELISDTLAEIQPLLKESHVYTRVDYQVETPKLNADKDLLRGAFINLFRNALEALQNQENGIISIQVTRNELPSGWEVTIADNGPGMTKETANRIFMPFFTTKPEGTGLGLPNVRKAVTLHRGSISVKSELKAGTEFKIFLPGDLPHA
jgi:signal transduction histidine kinase